MLYEVYDIDGLVLANCLSKLLIIISPHVCWFCNNPLPVFSRHSFSFRNIK